MVLKGSQKGDSDLSSGVCPSFSMGTVSDQQPWARHCASGYRPHHDEAREEALAPPVTDEQTGSERFKNLPKVTQTTE